MEGFTVQCDCGSKQPPTVKVDIVTSIHCTDCRRVIIPRCVTCGPVNVRCLPVTMGNGYQMRFRCTRCTRREFSPNFCGLVPTLDQKRAAAATDALNGITVPWRDEHV